jgi:FAD binding domain/D-arabinono-1,4-lactone oxidase
MGNLKVQNWFGDIQTYPRVVVEAESVEELAAILKDSENYPSPVRAIGSNHSPARCGVADQGTLIKMKMKRVLSISENSVTAEAGALYIDVAEELRKHGLQFYVNTEIGNLSIGSAACAGTKNASMPSAEGPFESGQVGSYVTSVKMVLPSGEVLPPVDETQADLLECIRSSYGTLGVIYEATFRVRPIQPMAVRYQTFTLEKFTEKFQELINGHESMMFFFFPFDNRITIEFRKYNPRAQVRLNRSVWRLRNFFWKTLGPFLCHEIAKHAPLAIRYRLIDRFNIALRFALVYLLRNDHTVSPDQIIRYPEVSNASRYTFSFCAFPEEKFPSVLADYFQFCQSYYQRFQYRNNMPDVGYRIAQDKKSLLSYSFEGPVITIDPVSTGEQGWDDFLQAYNKFCFAHGGVPLFNQTPGVTRPQVELAFADRLKRFAEHRKAYDPNNRLLNDYFKDLLW